MPVTKSGRYSLDAIDQWLEERGKGPYSQSRQSRDGTKKSESELRAEILQLKLDKERGELLQTKVVLGIGRRQITEARTMLEELPQLVVARLPSEITSEVRDGIRGDVEQAGENPEVEQLALMAGSQIGKTMAMLALFLWANNENPAPSMWVGPDQDEMRVSRDLIYRVCESSPELRPNILPKYLRNDRYIDFRDSLAYLAFPGSTQRISGKAAKFVMCNEVDRWRDVAHQGSTQALVMERVKAFFESLVVFESTPTDETSFIAHLYEQSNRGTYRCPCPHCDHYQELRFFKWKEGEFAGCGGVDGLQDAKGNWRSADEVPRHVFYRCERGSWLASRDKPERVRVFVNNWLGLPYKKKTNAPKWRTLAKTLAGGHRLGMAPAGAFFLTAGGDVQSDRCYYVVRAWGVEKRSWLVDRGVINIRVDEGGLTIPDSDLNEMLAAVLDRRYALTAANELGQEALRVRLFNIDSGYGERINDVFDVVRNRPDDRVRAVKGDPHCQGYFRRSLLERNARSGKPYPEGTEQWGVNVNWYKAWLHTQWAKGTDGHWLLPAEPLPALEDYLRQLCNEAPERKRNKAGREVMQWTVVDTSIGEHYWDCEVYDSAAADMVTGNQWSRDSLIQMFQEPEERPTERRGPALSPGGQREQYGYE
eukprot:g15864.t1